MTVTEDVVQRAANLAYPARDISEPDPARVDLDVPEHLLAALGSRIASLGVTVVAQPEVVRSHMLYVGLHDFPDWQHLNRSLTGAARVSEVSRHPEGIPYWIIMISRLGPFWHGYWNVFRMRDGRVVPEWARDHRAGDWPHIRRGVSRIFADVNLCEVRRDVLDARVKWSPEPRTTHKPVTIYDALFSDVV
jgi:hypothetical protein